MTGSDTYPTDTQFASAVEASCFPAFKTYTGLEIATEPNFDLGYFIPTPDGWGGGDRELTATPSGSMARRSASRSGWPSRDEVTGFVP